MTKPEPLKGTVKEQLRAIRIIVVAISSGIILFTAIIAAIVYFSGPFLEKEEVPGSTFFLGISVLFAIVFFYIAINRFNKKLTEIKNGLNSLADKLNLYRTAIILYLGLCELPALISAIIFLLTGNYYLLIITGVAVYLMFSKFPSGGKMADELNLDLKERQQFE